ncbi:MAG: hypothetical protein LRY67_03770 [Gammaproteobacteria bacterium]|nr:hypothetical protein [Gammaproteobacteria bacterium]MCD8524869.1 hypothetical protein [Gammaproteobacteria bacterium]
MFNVAELEKKYTVALGQFLNETTKQSQQAHDLVKGLQLGLKNAVSPLYGASALFQKSFASESGSTKVPRPQ